MSKYISIFERNWFSNNLSLFTTNIIGQSRIPFFRSTNITARKEMHAIYVKLTGMINEMILRIVLNIQKFFVRLEENIAKNKDL